MKKLVFLAAAVAAFVAVADIDGSCLVRDGSGGHSPVFFRNAASTNWVGGDLIVTWTNITANGSLTLIGPATMRMLVVGGGGSGGGKGGSVSVGSGGGGGAGGFIDTLTPVLCDAGTYSITVGAGGAVPAQAEAGVSGKNSTVSGPSADFTAIGGGGGGAAANEAVAGGSGGGASCASATSPGTGADGTAGQGYSGGACGFTRASGGGGGAGASGSAAVAQYVSGAGGEGKSSDITGASVLYAGGGGGGARQGTGSTGGLGGNGGGGRGAQGSEPSGFAGAAGIDGLGGGGGGGNNVYVSGKGGDGVVIIRISEARVAPVRIATLAADGSFGDGRTTAFVRDWVERRMDEEISAAITPSNLYFKAAVIGVGLGYDLSSTSSKAMADRTVNALDVNTTSTSVLTFPTATESKSRHFFLNMNYTKGTLVLPTDVTTVGDELTFTGAHRYLIEFTEIAANHFYVKVADITPPAGE